MPGSSKRAANIARARDLYARGVSSNEIARRIGVTRSTVRNWSLYDGKRGVSWNELRARTANPDPRYTLDILRKRLAQMAAEGGTTGPADPAEREHHEKKMFDMTRILKACEKTADELTLRLLALDEFAGYCVECLPREEIAVVRRAIEGYTDRLRRGSE